MKKVLITVGSISILFGIYMIIKKDTFTDQLPLFITGSTVLCSAFLDFKNKPKCNNKK